MSGEASAFLLLLCFGMIFSNQLDSPTRGCGYNKDLENQLEQLKREMGRAQAQMMEQIQAQNERLSMQSGQIQTQSELLSRQSDRILEQQEEIRMLREHVENCLLCSMDSKVDKISSFSSTHFRDARLRLR